MIAHSLRIGSIFVCPNFLPFDVFEEFSDKVKEYPFIEGYQPAGTFYGNRFQAFPCYESYDLWTVDQEYYNIFKNKHQEFLEDEMTFFICKIRKSITEEVKRSKVNGKYGHIHQDQQNGKDDAVPTEFASVFSFVQSYDGGTAFFENEGDTAPDIEVSAYKNRLVAYGSGRFHTSCTDFTFKERNVLVSFIRTEKMDFELRKNKLTKEALDQPGPLRSNIL